VRDSPSSAGSAAPDQPPAPLYAADPYDYGDARALMDSLELAEPVAITLVRRGHRTVEQARSFIAAADVHDPSAFDGIADAVAAIGARQLFIKPHCPWQNGKVERLNRTLATEWAYRQPYASNDQRTAALAPWLDYYNNERHHHGIGGQTPISRVQS